MKVSDKFKADSRKEYTVRIELQVEAVDRDHAWKICNKLAQRVNGWAYSVSFHNGDV